MRYFASFIIAFLVLAPVFPARAVGVLEDEYLLLGTTSTSVSAESPTGTATIAGIVTAVAGGQPNMASIYFKTQKLVSGGGTPAPVVPHAAFTPDDEGNFSNSVSNLECGQTYTFWLYEGTSLISVNTGSVSSGFQLAMNCSVGLPPSATNDVLAPSSAGANWIQGVNWGLINTTDGSISINGAHLIPIPPYGQKKFKIEWGQGSPNSLNEPINPVFLGESAVITRNPPYNFSFTIGALTPNTNYYINLWEVGSIDGGATELSTNLFTYAFTQTNQLTGGNNVQYTFPSPTSVHVFGHLYNSGGMTLMNMPITIEINNSGGTVVTSAPVVTGGADVIDGDGFFEANLIGLAPSTQYSITIKQGISGVVLIGPINFTTPAALPASSTATTATGPTYTGIVACNGPDCNFDKFIETLNRFINFIIFFIAFPIVGIVVAWAGIKLLLSGGSSEAKKTAKGMIFKVIVGLILALLCWVIIKLVLLTLGYHGPLWGVLGVSPEPTTTVP